MSIILIVKNSKKKVPEEWNKINEKIFNFPYGESFITREIAMNLNYFPKIKMMYKKYRFSEMTHELSLALPISIWKSEDDEKLLIKIEQYQKKANQYLNNSIEILDVLLNEQEKLLTQTE